MSILIIFVIILFVLGATIGGFYFTYILIKPYIKTKEGIKVLIKYISILCIISWGGAALAWFFTREPDYFEQGIDQLHKSKYITHKMGDFNSYTYRFSEIIKDPVSPIDFKVQINGDSLNFYLTCTMRKIQNKWILVYVKEDSVRVVKFE